jgi:hypothetical protein
VKKRNNNKSFQESKKKKEGSKTLPGAGLNLIFQSMKGRLRKKLNCDHSQAERVGRIRSEG